MKTRLNEEQSSTERRLNYYVKRAFRNEFKRKTKKNLFEVHHFYGSNRDDIDLQEMVLIPDDNDVYRIHNYIHNSIDGRTINLSPEQKSEMNNKEVYFINCDFVPMKLGDFITTWKALKNGS